MGKKNIVDKNTLLDIFILLWENDGPGSGFSFEKVFFFALTRTVPVRFHTRKENHSIIGTRNLRHTMILIRKFREYVIVFPFPYLDFLLFWMLTFCSWLIPFIFYISYSYITWSFSVVMVLWWQWWWWY